MLTKAELQLIYINSIELVKLYDIASFYFTAYCLLSESSQVCYCLHKMDKGSERRVSNTSPFI